jgi:hypothetical protein
LKNTPRGAFQSWIFTLVRAHTIPATLLMFLSFFGGEPPTGTALLAFPEGQHGVESAEGERV